VLEVLHDVLSGLGRWLLNHRSALAKLAGRDGIDAVGGGSFRRLVFNRSGFVDLLWGSLLCMSLLCMNLICGSLLDGLGFDRFGCHGSLSLRVVIP